MRLNAVVDIVGGELLSSSFVVSFENIRLDPKKVSREDLFIALDNSDIEKAIENGAYGVVFCGEVTISDSEVSFIKVESVEDAIKAIVRYFIASKNIKTFQIEKNQFLIGREIVRDKNTLFTEIEDLKTLVTSKEKLEEITKIFFHSEDLKDTIFPNSKKVNPKKLDIKILKSSIFYSEFIFKNETYRIEILKYYLQDLFDILAIFEKEIILYKIKDKINTESILKLDSVKTIICQENLELLSFIERNMPWINVENSYSADFSETLEKIQKDRFEIFLTQFSKGEIEREILKNSLIQGSLF